MPMFSSYLQEGNMIWSSNRKLNQVSTLVVHIIWFRSICSGRISVSLSCGFTSSFYFCAHSNFKSMKV